MDIRKAAHISNAKQSDEDRQLETEFARLMSRNDHWQRRNDIRDYLGRYGRLFGFDWSDIAIN